MFKALKCLVIIALFANCSLTLCPTKKRSHRELLPQLTQEEIAKRYESYLALDAKSHPEKYYLVSICEYGAYPTSRIDAHTELTELEIPKTEIKRILKECDNLIERLQDAHNARELRVMADTLSALRYK